MTAVVGILNKRGVALAADSAVTRSRVYQGDRVKKITKNGNKLIRISEITPISVMITGNADFLRNPWDIIIRRYRQERGDIPHSTVEACVHDLFDYISSNNILWSSDVIGRWIESILDELFTEIDKKIQFGVKVCKEDETLAKPKTYIKTFISLLRKKRGFELKNGLCPHFEEYTIDLFRDYAKKILDLWFVDKTITKPYTAEVISGIREELEMSLLTRLSTAGIEQDKSHKMDSHTKLVFAGYGVDQEYPSLVSTNVCGGFDNKVNYYIQEKDVICISDDKPIAICPFAQKDISVSIMRGIHIDWFRKILNGLEDVSNSMIFDAFDDNEGGSREEFYRMLKEVEYKDLMDKTSKSIKRQLFKNQRVWENKLKDCDLKTLALLAEDMINLTCFQRIVTFQPEGVGGLVDVAVITKNDGFSWLNRKSWYHNKDVNGQYGKLGI